MSRWIDIGYKWNTETTYRVREFLKEMRIPMRMPSDDMFFQSMFHLPHRDLMWGLKVREKDLASVLSLLEKEGLIYTVAGKGCFVAEKNLDLVREENLRRIEEDMDEIRALAGSCGLAKEEILEMWNTIWED